MSKRTLTDTKQWLRTARTITEALPFMRRYAGRTFVIKFGGHAMGDQKLARLVASDIVLLKQVGIHPIVVHGGGPQIAAMLDRLKIKTAYVDGLRVTDAETMEIVEMVLSGTINKQIVEAINAAGGAALGLSGKDANLIQATKLRRPARDQNRNLEPVVDLGFVGEPSKINPQVLTSLEQSGMIPIVAPIGVGASGETYNINADTVAGALAAALGAARLLLLTDVVGVLDKQGTLIPEVSVAQVRGLLEDGIVTGGMIPKLETCIAAVETGVEAAVILDGRVPHSMLLEVFTDRGIGTIIRSA